jgi:hypothetical protein
MKVAQVNKLYSKLTLHEKAALAFEASVRQDDAERTAIINSIPKQAYEMRSYEFFKRNQEIVSLSLLYGMIWWKTYTYVIRYGNNAARLANIDAALVEVCRRIKVDIESVRMNALCANISDFSQYAEAGAEEIAEITEIFMSIFS